MVFGFAVSAGACYGYGCMQMPSSDVTVENIHTDVVTVAKADVNTGDVFQMGGFYSKVSTGDVYGVYATGLSQVNTTKLPGCACSMFGDTEVKNIHTDVVTIAKADASTGDVKQMSFGGFQKTYTGNVTYVFSDASAGVNYVDFSVDTPVIGD